MSGRILHLLSQRPGWTGSGVALDAIVRTADHRGWQQLVVLGTPRDEPAPDVGGLDAARIRPLVFERDGLPFPLPGMSDVMPYASSRFSKMTDRQLAAYGDAWRKHVARAVDEFEPDVIHSHHIWLLSAIVKDIAPRIPVVTHCHGTGLRQLQLCPHLADRVRAGCARNDAFFVLHDGHAEQIAEALGVATERIHVIGSGFREDVFHVQDRLAVNGPVLTYAGKLSRAKGLPWLLDAVERLVPQVPGLVLNVAGSGAGEEADAIRERIEASNHIVFHGQLNQTELANLMRRSAVFVLPSFYEGLPLVLVEAAACGCRLVTTELPGVINQLSPHLGESLQLVPLPRLENSDQPVAEDLPRFVESLTVAVKLSLQRPPLNHIGGLVAGMTWSAVYDRIEAIWRQLVSAAAERDEAALG